MLNGEELICAKEYLTVDEVLCKPGSTVVSVCLLIACQGIYACVGTYIPQTCLLMYIISVCQLHSLGRL
jgi:hypothetical protein